MGRLIHFAKFLTNTPIEWKISKSETYQLAVFIKYSAIATAKYRFWKNGIITGYQTFIDTTPAIAGIADQVDGLIDTRRFVININPADFDCDKFDVWVEIDGIRRTEIRTFNIIENCGTRIKWINLFGAEDQYTFDADKNLNLSVAKIRGIRELDFPFNLTDKGITAHTIMGNYDGVLFSQFEKESTIKWLSEMFLSPQCWIMETPLSGLEADLIDETKQRIPIDVTTDSHVLEHKELIQIKFSYRYANSLITQNG